MDTVILSSMEHSFVTKMLILIFVVLSMLYAVFFVVNVVCRTSVTSCTVDADCSEGTVCVDQGDAEIRCAPPACKTAQNSYTASGIGAITDRTIAWIAKESSIFSHWLLSFQK
jgi:hypothetical protein